MKQQAAGSPHPYQWAIDGRLDPSFWDKTPTLQDIYAAARLRKASPDVVLHGVLTRMAALVPPCVRVYSGMQDPASLNYFSIGIAPSGGGKTTAWRVAKQLVPSQAWQIADFPDGGSAIGTGEGIVELFMGRVEEQVGMAPPKGGGKPEPVMGKVKRQTKHNALFYVDEGETIEQLLKRNGATLITVLRSSWVSEGIGQTNAEEERRRMVEAGSYSMGVMISYQPQKMANLLGDQVGGTPQRFMFAPASDPFPQTGVMPRVNIEPIEGLAEHCLSFAADADPVLELPMSAQEELVREYDDNHAAGGIQDELDTHKPLHLAKTAALLALLHQEEKVSVLHWELAQEMWAASCRMRAVASGWIEDSARSERAKSAQMQGQQRMDMDEYMTSAKVLKIAARMRELVDSRPAPWPLEKASTRGLDQKWHSRDRGLLGEACDYGVAQGWFRAYMAHEIEGEGSPIKHLTQVDR